MTKTLTEQWREGTLPKGYYYIIPNTKAMHQVIFYLPENTYTDGAVIKGEVVNGEDGGWVVEVLAPVPSYDEYRELLDLNVYEKDRKKVMGLEDKIKHLQERLAIATKALKNAHKFPSTISLKEYCEQALKEMEGVK